MVQGYNRGNVSTYVSKREGGGNFNKEGKGAGLDNGQAERERMQVLDLYQ